MKRDHQATTNFNKHDKQLINKTNGKKVTPTTNHQKTNHSIYLSGHIKLLDISSRNYELMVQLN
jgi:hypothetical protein